MHAEILLLFSGYEYLDKIVQVPYALLDLTVDEVENMLKGFLTGGGEEGPPDLSELVTSIANQGPIPLEDVKSAGPLLLKWETYPDDKQIYFLLDGR